MKKLLVSGLFFFISIMFLIQCKREKRKVEEGIEGGSGGMLVFEDTFERDDVGELWINRSKNWKINKGEIHIEGDGNEGLWLQKPLPDRVRIEFDARSESKDGDIKVECFAIEPLHQSGYIFILGGWENTISIIARKNEHGEDRIENQQTAEIGKTYHWTIIRTNGIIYWLIDGNLFMKYEDPNPIRGKYFGFNNWRSSLYFDNLRIYSL